MSVEEAIKDQHDFRNNYIALSMAIRSMSCQMIGIQSSVWGSEDTYNRYEGYIKELRKRKDDLVSDWLFSNWVIDAIKEQPRPDRYEILKQVKEEYKNLEELSIRHTKEVYEEAKNGE